MLRSRQIVAFAACSGALALAPAGAGADDGWTAVVEPARPVYKSEAWIGGDATARAWSVYGGTTWAPFGDIRADGLRVRSAGGIGAYRYVSPRWNGAARVPVAFAGAQTYGDLLVGWQQTLGAWTVKAFAGGTRETHLVAPFDDENAVQGERIGFKAALETWLSLGDWAYVQSEISWSEPYAARGLRVRGGWRFDPAWSAGLESAYIGNANYDAGRLGAFARFEWTRGEVSLSGGVAGDRAGDAAAYGSIGMLFRF